MSPAARSKRATSPVVYVRLPAEPSLADLFVFQCILPHLNDVEVRIIDSNSSDEAPDPGSTLCISTLPAKQDPGAVLVRGAVVEGETQVSELVVCANLTRNIRSSAGYTVGTQLVGNFLPPIGRRKPKSGTLNLSREAAADHRGDMAYDLIQALASAEQVITVASSPVVTMALGFGAVVLLADGSDEVWPLLEDHTSTTSTSLGRTDGPSGRILPSLSPSTTRDRSEAGAGPRVARLLRQAAYLSF